MASLSILSSGVKKESHISYSEGSSGRSAGSRSREPTLLNTPSSPEQAWTSRVVFCRELEYLDISCRYRTPPAARASRIASDASTLL